MHMRAELILYLNDKTKYNFLLIGFLLTIIVVFLLR